MKVLLIDAYDSFVHIIQQYLRDLGVHAETVRSKTLSEADLLAWGPDAVVLGPGPGHPADSGHVELVRLFADRVPVLGVCLGHQAIGMAFGAEVRVSGRPMHGRTSVVRHDGRGVFTGLAPDMVATRYHSLVVGEPLPEVLEATAHSTDDGFVMGLRHRHFPVEGIQFHPESITTVDGMRLLENFLTASVAAV
ncbi:anthranilate synthase component II [Micromonospora sp. NPDC048898]|uniref:anthranilate synthase component II n=1 Tax=Micromonospora sp. NPDC048898 TaxID=3364260 RepID=UPI003712D45F